MFFGFGYVWGEGNLGRCVIYIEEVVCVVIIFFMIMIIRFVEVI